MPLTETMTSAAALLAAAVFLPAAVPAGTAALARLRFRARMEIIRDTAGAIADGTLTPGPAVARWLAALDTTASARWRDIALTALIQPRTIRTPNRDGPDRDGQDGDGAVMGALAGPGRPARVPSRPSGGRQ
jgi:hypothetical protein